MVKTNFFFLKCHWLWKIRPIKVPAWKSYWDSALGGRRSFIISGNNVQWLAVSPTLNKWTGRKGRESSGESGKKQRREIDGDRWFTRKVRQTEKQRKMCPGPETYGQRYIDEEIHRIRPGSYTPTSTTSHASSPARHCFQSCATLSTSKQKQKMQIKNINKK